MERSAGKRIQNNSGYTGRFLFALALIPALVTFSIPAASDITPEDPSGPDPSQQERAIDEVTNPFPDARDTGEGTTAEPVPPGKDECDWDLEGQPFQEQSQEVIRSWSCHSFRWFDSWWGNTKDFDEKSVNGWVTVGASYRRYDNFDTRLRLKVRAPLPNLSSSWDVLFRRANEEAYISDTQPQDQTFYNPGVVDRGDQDSWLLGLGHRRKKLRKGWDWSVGLRLRLPPQPYAKASYFYNTQTSENSDMRLRQTFFWRSDDGFGTTSRGDLAWGMSANNVMRWEGVATVSEDTDGARWYFGQTWYHLMGNRSAFSLLAFARGETQDPVELKDCGLNFIWRRPFTRDWMYISMGPSITWPRKLPEDERELNLGFGIWLEMEFGDWRY